MGCTRNREAFVNSGSWDAVRELAAVEAIANTTIIEIDAILALLMPTPQRHPVEAARQLSVMDRMSIVEVRPEKSQPVSSRRS